MSFPRAKTKRFNDFVSDAPPPTAYDVKLDAQPVGPASFLRGPRFRAPEVDCTLGSAEDCSLVGATTPAASRCNSARRTPQLGRHGVAPGKASVRPSVGPLTSATGRSGERASASSGNRVPAGTVDAASGSMSNKAVQTLPDEEAGRIQPCDSCTSLRRELDELRACAEHERATLSSDADRLRTTLAARELELHEAKSSALAAEQALATSIDSSRACLSSLTDQLNLLQGECHLMTRREAEARAHAETLQGMLDHERLRAEKEAECMRARLDALLARLAAGDGENVDGTCSAQPASTDHCAKALQDYRDALEDENQELLRELKLLEVQSQQDAESIRSLKGELFAADDYRRQAEDELLSLRGDLADLCANIETLQESGVANERALQTAQEEKLRLREALDASEKAKMDAERELADARAVLVDALEQCKASDENSKQLQEASTAERARLLQAVEQLREQVELQQRVSEVTELRCSTMATAAAASPGSELPATSPASSADTANGEASCEDDNTAEGHLRQPACRFSQTTESEDRDSSEPVLLACRVVRCSASKGCEYSTAVRLHSAVGTAAGGDAQDTDRRLFELELKLAELEADSQRAKVDYESQLVLSKEAGAALAVDCKYWRDMYEVLHAKVSPFQEQLDAYEAEKAALLSRSQHRAEELAALSDAYAKLLGHQNQRQKIQHVVKIKDENRTLKKELESMRVEREKLKRAVAAKDDKLSALEGRRRFDTTLAFKHGADVSACAAGHGDSVLATPLKDCSNSLRTPKR